ncbi:MAG: imidazole glycerol phosphate synthase subunit HisH [Pseudodesulfovibrio sp.]|uniref:imidazole glycerol phosphate synthase subunit HisH n=1 Tax=Pseudodesulfovibrio sp. TaxID=2035812 RepID=UPI003D0E7BB0
MPNVVHVLDYGVGNLFSIANALRTCGAETVLASGPGDLKDAERIILPGVGAIGPAMRSLAERNLVEAVRERVLDGLPLLGICLGMQILFDVSEEFGEHQGLGLVPGRVKMIPSVTVEGAPLRIPHIGWNRIGPVSPNGWSEGIFTDLAEGQAFYFVHSLTGWPDDEGHRLADCAYGGHRISAAVRNGNVCGVQFHPEKSGPAGLSVLRRFVAG